jgi:CRISPR/Cas system-associated exonuclease Cas4 (RecB family)
MKIPDRKLLIEKEIEGRVYPGRLSTYIGPSALGNECPRAIWLKFRNAGYPAPITARQKRLFSRGDREEPIVLADLKEAGVEILTTQEKVVYLAGHGMGFSDGRVTNLPDAPKTEHLLEIKTANDKNFAAIAMKGVEKAKPDHYLQIQLYMHLFGLSRALYIAVNKNTDERHYERIDYNRGYAEDQIRRAEDILNASTPPPKRETYKCKWCDYRGICQDGDPVRKGCRICVHAAPMPGGKWVCQRKRKVKNLERKKQLKGCKKFVAVSVV